MHFEGGRHQHFPCKKEITRLVPSATTGAYFDWMGQGLEFSRAGNANTIEVVIAPPAGGFMQYRFGPPGTRSVPTDKKSAALTKFGGLVTLFGREINRSTDAGYLACLC